MVLFMEGWYRTNFTALDVSYGKLSSSNCFALSLSAADAKN